MNKLYFGDNLDVMKRLFYNEKQKEFIDLVYIDPPFNSKRNYNVLFESAGLENTKAQKEAFADTWTNVHYLDELAEIKEIDLNLHRFIESLDLVGISKGAVSYLTTMAIRIWYMHKLLKPTGSFYLHCDPTMSHYLKIVCDLIFGDKNFGNEITWQRTNAHSDAKNKFPDVNDIILFFRKTNKAKFFPQFIGHDKSYLGKFYRFTDNNEKGLYTLGDLASPNPRPNMMYEWKGFPFPDKGWRYELTTMTRLDAEGRIYYPKNKSGQYDFTKRPRLKRYLNEQKGTIIGNNWTDIPPLGAHEKERLGYPTQKPEALMERIISASSNEGDLVADFFCGCGTTIAAAQNLKRQWLGSDISHLAIKLIAQRLAGHHGEAIRNTFEIFGFPRDIDSARELAEGTRSGRLKFEEWVVEVMLSGILNERRNTLGFDGHFTFDMNGKKQVGLIEVKSGKASPTQVNHFIRTVEDKQAQMGVFVCFAAEVTNNMLTAAKKQGKLENFGYDKIQIITVEDLLGGKLPNRPVSRVETFKQAERKKAGQGEQGRLELH